MQGTESVIKDIFVCQPGSKDHIMFAKITYVFPTNFIYAWLVLNVSHSSEKKTVCMFSATSGPCKDTTVDLGPLPAYFTPISH